MDSRRETQVKIDYAGTVQEVPNLKGHKIAQLAQKISFWHFWCEKLLIVISLKPVELFALFQR